MHKHHSNNQINPNNVFGLEHWMDAGILFDFGWVTFSSVGVDIYCFLGMFATPVERLSARNQLSFHDLSLFYSHHIGTDCFSKTQCQKMRFLRKNTEKPLASAFNGCDYRNNRRQKQSFRGVKSVQCPNAMFPAFGWAFWKASFHRMTEAKHVLKPGQLHGAQSLLNNTPMDFRRSEIAMVQWWLGNKEIWIGFPMVSLWFPHFVGDFVPTKKRHWFLGEASREEANTPGFWEGIPLYRHWIF